MSSIIQKVSYKKEDAKQLLEKLEQHLGVQKLQIVLKEGAKIEAILTEIGIDYIAVIEGKFDVLIPVSNILYIRYSQ
ncbi:hypothetical protein KJ966_10695 [bacterium]|nr:hypothetical protein [bacterium]